MKKTFSEGPEATPESVGMSSKKLENLYNLSGRYVKEGQLPGVISIVVRDGYRSAVVLYK